MRKIAIIFPGQGSQSEGMGSNLFKDDPEARRLKHLVSSHLGEDLDVVLNNQTKLNRTAFAQLAILWVSSLIYDRLLALGIKPDAVAGFSLGEYTALWASGAITFDDVIHLVDERSKLMERDALKRPGKMMAIIGLPTSVVEEVIEALDEPLSRVVVANLNAPGQTVISGSLKGVLLAKERLKVRGAKRLVELAVAGAFHSPLMEDAAYDLEVCLKTIQVKEPIVAFYQNVTGNRSTVTEIKPLLVRHMTEPVRFEHMIRTMIKDGIDTFIEAGPGHVLKGLIKRIDPDVTTMSVSSEDELEQLKGLITS
ncbi:MAG: ACP S-malonyltransferase [Acholeplasmataceae bacterium]|nr:ACP S-malonyltransferase [Acholeplasmataceae bacterium]